MPDSRTSGRKTRRPLTADRVLKQAIALADEGGIEALSMRKLAGALGVEAMSLYHHVRSKDEILDRMVDHVFSQFLLPDPDQGWREALRARSRSVREVLLRHRWALPLLESRTMPGPATLLQYDATLACFRRGGFSIPMAARAFALLDSFVYGFILTESMLPFEAGMEAADLASAVLNELPEDAYRYIREFTLEHVAKPDYDFRLEFEPGLELVLDALETLRSDG